MYNNKTKSCAEHKNSTEKNTVDLNEMKIMDETEALGVIKCVYNAYGKTFVNKAFYDENKLINLNKENKLISCVAKNEASQVIGHVGISPNKNLKTSEICAAFVHSSYRGNGCLNKLADFAIKTSKSRGDIACYVYAVTSHYYSQKAAHKNNFKDCALFLHKAPSLNFKNIKSKNRERESLLLSFKYFKEQNKRNIYVTQKYEKILKQIYENLNIPVKFKYKKFSIMPTPSKSSINAKKDNYNNIILNIKTIGKNTCEEISNIIIKSKKENINSIFLTINIENKDTPYIISHTEKMGFLFGGVLPGDKNKDLLLFQYNLKNIPPENIIIESDIGKSLLNFIKNQYKNNIKNQKYKAM